MAIRILIADDHEVVRAGIASLLAETDIVVASEVSTGEDAVSQVLEIRPDVAVLDVRMNGGDGLTALGRIQLDLPNLPVVIFSTYDNPTYVARAVALGASGYILKREGGNKLIDAIRAAASGENVWKRDEEEPATAAQWKARLGKRLQRASDVFDRYGILRFRVVSYGRWKSDNREQDLSRSLSEFEQQVQPNRGAIAIGFTSQYRFSPGRHQLGGTRGPLHSHILIRENNPRAVEMERLELLVHELGHFLGAVHTDQVGSVMRPVLTSRQPRDRLKIEFDPENARVIRLFGEEVSNLKVRRASQLTDDTKENLRQVYRQIQQRMPNDPTVKFYLNLIE